MARKTRAGRKFCSGCGGTLALTCSGCGAANEPGEGFCGECGSPLGAGTAPVAAPALPSTGQPTSGGAPTAERRLVSVLFADLVGFTPFSEARDSEEVREMLTRYFDLSTEIITRYGGTVEKFIGDAVMAVWGTPTTREDDAERSVRAALDLVGAVSVLGDGISARAGVLTGEAAVTLGATNQGMVAGDIVNTAARLQAAALPGTVLVGESTYRAASAAIVFEQAGDQSLKGKTAPVPAWRASRVVAEVGGRGRSDMLEAPFVGRDDDLRMLKDLFHATEREGRIRLVSVTGIGGIGKSRLVWEFQKYVDGIADTFWWHRGRSPAYGAGISFWALGEMIRGRSRLAESADERTTRAGVAAMLDGISLPDADRRWIEPALLTLLGIDTGTAAEQLFGAWRMFFEHLSQTAPVIMVFEDLHWADSGTLDFIDHLLEWSRTSPIYVVTLARPELLDRHAEWGAGRRNFASLYLEPLSEASMRELLTRLIPGLSEGAVRSIVGRAEGIPLYAVETVRMLLAEGRLEATGSGTYAPLGDLTTLAIPETLTALIAARLDGLVPADRSLVMDAAVLGQSFTPGGLAMVSGIAETDLEQRLRALVRRELFGYESDPRSPERGQYAFVQGLIREVAYNTLAKRDRKTRHLAAARYFASLDTDEIASAVAGHYLAARNNACDADEADALAAKARVALTDAGERAAALGGHVQAFELFEQAIAVTNEPAQLAALSERSGETASSAGRHEAAISRLRDAVDLRRQSGDRVASARTTTALARALTTAQSSSESVTLLEPAVAEFEDLAEHPAGIALGAEFARALYLNGETARSLAAADRTLQAAEHADLPAIIADTLVTKGTVLAGSLGRPIEGLGAIEAGRKLAETHGLLKTVLRAQNNWAVTNAPRDPAAAAEVTEAALAVARRLGERTAVAGFVWILGVLACRTGDWSRAITEIEAALGDEYEASDRAGLLTLLSAMYAFRGVPVQERLDEVERLLGPVPDRQSFSWFLVTTAWSALASGLLAEARAGAHRSAEVCDSEAVSALPTAARAALWARDATGAANDLAALDATGNHGPAIEADRLTIRAGLAALEGRSTDAIMLYRTVLQAWRDLGLRWDEALTGLDMATLLDITDPDVRAAATTARAIMVDLEAAPFIARLDAAMAGTTAVAGS